MLVPSYLRTTSQTYIPAPGEVSFQCLLDTLAKCRTSIASQGPASENCPVSVLSRCARPFLEIRAN
eukprot:7617694-Pyramimonas_sp.AAC.1